MIQFSEIWWLYSHRLCLIWDVDVWSSHLIIENRSLQLYMKSAGGIFQQLLWQDLVLYMLNTCLWQNQNWQLIAYSESVLLFNDENSSLPFWFQKHLQNILKENLESAGHIHDILSLHSENLNFCDVIVSEIHEVLENWWQTYSVGKTENQQVTHCFLLTDFQKVAGLTVEHQLLADGSFCIVDSRISIEAVGCEK